MKMLLLIIKESLLLPWMMVTGFALVIFMSFANTWCNITETKNK